MRFMVLVKAGTNSEAGVLPSRELLTEMGKFNEELVKAGVLLAGEGLHPSSKGVRIKFSGRQRTTLGPYGLQSAIAACHARAHIPSETDWERIAALYEALAQVAPSPVVELNRAVALEMAYGPAAGLEVVDALTSEPSLEANHLLPSVRGDLLAKVGCFDEARAEFERAASLTRNERERTLLLERANACA